MRREDHFTEPYQAETHGQLSVEALARAHFRSPSQFSRDFYAAAGYSVHEYQRCRRLSQALCLIRSSGLSLADISYRCGYSSQQALCREVKAILHMTATEYRESEEYYFLSEPVQDIPWITEVSTVKIPRTLCLSFYHPVLRGLESLAVHSFLQANPAYHGRIFGRNGKQQKNRFCYKLYVEDTGELNTAGFSVGMLHPAYSAVCAQIRVHNREEDISAAWDWLYSVWLPKSMFAYAGAEEPVFEKEYFEEYYHKDVQIRRLRLVLPVQRRDSLWKITLEKQTLTFLVSDCTGPSAETEASRTVLTYLAHTHPEILQDTRTFYFRQDDNRCTCGAAVGKQITPGERLRMIRYENTPCAILHFQGMHAYAEAAERLEAWCSENGIRAADRPFAVYDTSVNEDNPRMMLYCPLKNDGI